MKHILLLLLTCLPLCAATTYPMLSTTTNRTITGGVTNLGFLNANQTFTGTNTFSGSVVFTGFRARILFKTNNVFIPILQAPTGTQATFTTTNYSYMGGGVSTNLFTLTLPALMSTNSRVGWMSIAERTNSIANNVFFDFVVGSNLCASSGQFLLTSAPRRIAQYQTPYGEEIFRNHSSAFTVQLMSAPSAALTTAQTFFYEPASYVNTSAPWTLAVGALPNTDAVNTVTNIFLREFVILEQWYVE